MTNKLKIQILKSGCVALAWFFLISIGFSFASLATASGPEFNQLYPFASEGISAKAYVVTDALSGEILLEKNSQASWVPASLTKMVSAMVVLDQNPNFKSIIKMQKADEVGGARIATKAGIAYKMEDLFFASLVASANNATNAIARSAGLSKDQFVQKMNEKVLSLGALNSAFIEPTGIDPQNRTTAQDYSKILKAALTYPKIAEAVKKTAYSFKATNSTKYRHNLKATDVLLSDTGLIVVGGKTGYLDESGYNFAGEFKDVDGKNIIVVLFGSKSHAAQFFETKSLAIWTWVNYKWPVPQVAGASISSLKMPE